MAVGCVHFVPSIEPTIYHPKKKELSKEALELWNTVEKSYNNMIGTSDSPVTMQPVLPNLVTSTDECTVFATASIINGKETLYIVSKPQYLKNKEVNSGSRNHYKKTMSGDSHCRGVRIVINSSFTAGGLTSPLFVVVYGLTADEMPGDDMITLEIPGLYAGSEQNIYSSGKGFITFVRGKYDIESDVINDNENMQQDDTVPDNDEVSSKESRIAAMYRQVVYHPFVNHIRKTKYGWNGDVTDIPDYLRVISWMDGANGQLRRITSDENMRLESELKIVCCKHSAARTAVEQAADVGPMFKLMKQLLKVIDIPHLSNNSILAHLENELTRLESNDLSTTGQVLKLLSHKKKAILATVPKLPSATGSAYSISNIKKGFVLNGQLDMDQKLVPSIGSILNTYRGEVEGTVLENKATLFKNYYEEMFTYGMIKEETFDYHQVPIDTKADGSYYDRDFDIQLENRQRAKILSAPHQIQARKNLLYQKRMDSYNKEFQLFEAEEKEFETNKRCEDKLAKFVSNDMFSSSEDNDLSTPSTTNETSVAFQLLSNSVTYDILSSNADTILNSELKSFVRVRSNVQVRGGRLTYSNVPTTKDRLMLKVVELRNHPKNGRMFNVRPTPPVE